MARNNRQCVICDQPSTTGTCEPCRRVTKNAQRAKRVERTELADDEERSRKLRVELYREVLSRGGRLFEPAPARRRKLKPKG